MTDQSKLIENHPFVVDALRRVDVVRQRMEDLRSALVAGKAVTAEDLAIASADLEHTEVLVDRARREADEDLKRREAARSAAADIRAALDAVNGDAVADADDAVIEIGSVLTRMWIAAQTHTNVVRDLAGRVRLIEGYRGYGLDLQRVAPGPVLVRAEDAMLVETPPVAVACAALLEVLEAHDPVSTGEPTELRSALKAAAAPWRQALDLRAPAGVDLHASGPA